MKFYRTAAAAALLMAAAGCSKDDKDDKGFRTEKSPVVATEVSGPAMADVPVNIRVSFAVYNGCGQFHAFEVTKDKDTLVVTVMARYPEEAFCTQDVPIRNATFTHTFPGKGKHYVKYATRSGDAAGTWDWHRDTLEIR